MQVTRKVRYGVWGLLCVCIVAGLFFLTEKERILYVQSAERGIEWLRTYQDSFSNPGILWVIDDVNARYCKSDTFSQELIQRFQQRDRTQAEHAYFSFLSFSPAPTSTLPAHIDGKYDRWLLSSLLCKDAPPDEALMSDILNIEDAVGYDLTHKYLALSYLSRSSCQINHLEVRHVKDSAAQKIAREAKDAQYVFSDLLAEQGAFLIWGGDGFLVNHTWKESVLSAQRSSGGWAGAVGETENPHTTALATWMFTLLSRACPL